MLKTIAKKIDIHQTLLAKATRNEYDKSKTVGARMFWRGVRVATEAFISDLKDIQEKAEMDVSSIDHCLDALRGL